MRGDDAQRIVGGSEETRVRKGPRHAAPRKSLLTKLQIPAGKAMALAAMPTAVFVGMGFTPRLALADDRDVPFAPGPCVTRSDEPDASPAPPPSASAPERPKPDPETAPEPDVSPSPTASPDPERAPEPEPGRGPEPSGSAEPSGSVDPYGSADPYAPPAVPEPAATVASAAVAAAAPSAGLTTEQSANPLDPLVLGAALAGLLDGSGDEATGSPSPGPSADGEPHAYGSPDDTESDDEDATDDEEVADPGDAENPEDAEDTTDSDDGKKDSDDGEKDSDEEATKEATKDAIKDAADEAGAKVEELGKDAEGLAPRTDDDIPAAATGKEPFPCPTADPEALAAAEQEPGIPLLPDHPWRLDSSRLTLNGLDYKGIVEVKTGSGKIKKALKFTASSLDIKDLHQTAVYPEGRTVHAEARAGSVSTIRDGEVTMYTEELKGNLFGLIPVTFSPQTPPPLNIPFAFFTDAHVVQAGQFGGTLTIPGLRNYLTG
ncbi:hypothetical protein ACIOEX_02100 [Streptomyces sp. NPDC087850]|uniref:hypothetical protein n=1 Tax=Streptomyces sp. NPDC087850 TaxID=3365809 RepID=UPI003823D2E4